MSKLPLDLFVDTNALWRSDKFQNCDTFQFLGKALTRWIEEFLKELGVTNVPVIMGQVHATAVIHGAVYIAEGARVEPHAYVQGPTIIAPHCEVRHAAYIRGSVYGGSHAVIGHTTEAKGSVFFDHAKAGHFAYVGDSVLGAHCNLGAGTKLANLKLQGDAVRFKSPIDDKIHDSGLRKFGAILGDRAQTGCNAVLSPGTILMKDTAVMPAAHFHGTQKVGIAGRK